MVSSVVRFLRLIRRHSIASVFLLFEEPIGGYEIPACAPEHGVGLEQRRGWNAAAFGEKYGLKLVGADFFLLRAVDLVPAEAVE